MANETDLDSAWDFTLTYMRRVNAGLIQRVGSAGQPSGDGDPTGIPTFLEAIEKQMGL